MAMWIIPSAANEDGGRSNMQTWNGATPPDGYLWCDEQYVDTYCQAKGFVNLEVDGDTLGVGQMVDVPDGTYHTDTATVKVEKGIITEVETLEVEDVVEDVVENMAEEPEPMVEEPETTEETEIKPSEMEELKALVQQIVDEVEKIKKQLADTTALPIDEMAKKCEPKQLNSRTLEIAEAIKQLNSKQ